MTNEGTGKPDRLLLSAREAAAAFRDRHVVAERMAGDEAFHAGKARGRKDFLVGRGGPAQGDVVANLAEKQVGILQHETDAGAQIGRIVLAGVDIIDGRSCRPSARRSLSKGGQRWSCRNRRGR